MILEDKNGHRCYINNANIGSIYKAIGRYCHRTAVELTETGGATLIWLNSKVEPGYIAIDYCGGWDSIYTQESKVRQDTDLSILLDYVDGNKSGVIKLNGAFIDTFGISC